MCTGEKLEKRKQESTCNIKNRLLPGSKNPDGLVDWFFYMLNAISYRSTASQLLFLFDICLKKIYGIFYALFSFFYIYFYVIYLYVKDSYRS